MRLTPAPVVQAAMLSLLAAVPASASTTITVDFFDAGFFGSDGRNSKEDADALGFSTAPGGFSNYHVGLSDGYAAGPPYPDTEVRNFFVFDWDEVAFVLGGPAPGPIVSATLSLYNPGLVADGADGYDSVSAFETYTVSDTGPYPAAAVMEHYDHPFYGGPDESGLAMMIFDALGTGPSFGTVDVSAADNGSYVDIVFTGMGLGYLNGMFDDYLLGGDTFVSFGGKLDTITPGAPGGTEDPYEEIFAYTHPGTEGSPDTSATPPKLTLTFIPEPTTPLLIGAAALLAVPLRRRKA